MRKNKRNFYITALALAVILIIMFFKLNHKADAIKQNDGVKVVIEQQEDTTDADTDSDDKDISKEVAEKGEKDNIEIVNKSHSLPKDYRPDDLRVVNIRFNHPRGTDMTMLRDEAATHAEEMVAAAAADGINLIGVSGFRSYEYQEELYNAEIDNNGQESADRLVAMPGYSEHNTGLALDLYSEDYQNLDENFDTTEAFRWLCKKGPKYGFILRYPKDKEKVTGYAYESWHFRYVGAEVAKEISKKNITLEEYIMAK